MNLVQRLKSLIGLGTEGSPRGPFLGRGENGGWYPFNILGDGWQQNIGIPNGRGVAVLQSCLAAYVSAFALMPASHRTVVTGGGTELITTSALSRWLRKPNAFQTACEFWSAGIRRLFESGNVVAALIRNDRNEIVTALWASSYSTTIVEGELFYSLSFQNTPDLFRDGIVPARDVLHLRINADTARPFDGRSPIVWCASSLTSNARLTAFLESYIANRASPSYVLSTDLPLTAEQVRQLRALWDEQSKSIASGGTPILSNGLKPAALGVAPGDDLLVSTFNMTVEDVARAFGIPKALVGIDETASNAEQMMRAWVSLGLGSVIEMVEQAIERAFGLDINTCVEFDHNALLRLDAEAQMRMVKEGVTGGVISTDEGRAVIGYPPLPGGYGKMPTQQQQQIPLDLLHAFHENTIARNAAPPPAPAPAPVPPADNTRMLASLDSMQDDLRRFSQQIKELAENAPVPDDASATRSAVLDMLQRKRAA